jgi:hypothetical protein
LDDTASAASSSGRGRFSAVFTDGTGGFVLGAAGFVLDAEGFVLGAGVDAVELSGRRAAILGIGFAFFTGSSTTLVRILTGESFGGS